MEFFVCKQVLSNILGRASSRRDVARARAPRVADSTLPP
jgi:hypothetical protein